MVPSTSQLQPQAPCSPQISVDSFRAPIRPGKTQNKNKQNQKNISNSASACHRSQSIEAISRPEFSPDAARHGQHLRRLCQGRRSLEGLKGKCHSPSLGQVGSWNRIRFRTSFWMFLVGVVWESFVDIQAKLLAGGSQQGRRNTRQVVFRADSWV